MTLPKAQRQQKGCLTVHCIDRIRLRTAVSLCGAQVPQANSCGPVLERIWSKLVWQTAMGRWVNIYWILTVPRVRVFFTATTARRLQRSSTKYLYACQIDSFFAYRAKTILRIFYDMSSTIRHW